MTFDLKYIFVQVVKAQVGQKGELKDSVSRDYCYLCVNIIRSYICLGSNRQLRTWEAHDVCNKYAVRHDMTVFPAIFEKASKFWAPSYKNASNPPTVLVVITGCKGTYRDLFRLTVLQKCGRFNNCSWDYGLWVEYLKKTNNPQSKPK